MSEGERADLVGAVQKDLGDGRVLGGGGAGGLAGEGETAAGEVLAQAVFVGREAGRRSAAGGQGGEVGRVEGAAGEGAQYGLPHLDGHPDPGLLVGEPVRVEEQGEPLQHLLQPPWHLVVALGRAHVLDADAYGGRAGRGPVPGVLRYCVEFAYGRSARPFAVPGEPGARGTERGTAQGRVAQPDRLVEGQGLVPAPEAFRAVTQSQFGGVLAGDRRVHPVEVPPGRACLVPGECEQPVVPVQPPVVRGACGPDPFLGAPQFRRGGLGAVRRVPQPQPAAQQMHLRGVPPVTDVLEQGLRGGVGQPAQLCVVLVAGVGARDGQPLGDLGG